MEKNIWEYVMNNKGEVIEKVADYIGVESFAKVIESLYRECLENFDDADDLRRIHCRFVRKEYPVSCMGVYSQGKQRDEEISPS